MQNAWIQNATKILQFWNYFSWIFFQHVPNFSLYTRLFYFLGNIMHVSVEEIALLIIDSYTNEQSSHLTHIQILMLHRLLFIYIWNSNSIISKIYFLAISEAIRCRTPLSGIIGRGIWKITSPPNLDIYIGSKFPICPKFTDQITW